MAFNVVDVLERFVPLDEHAARRIDEDIQKLFDGEWGSVPWDLCPFDLVAADIAERAGVNHKWERVHCEIVNDKIPKRTYNDCYLCDMMFTGRMDGKCPCHQFAPMLVVEKAKAILKRYRNEL